MTTPKRKISVSVDEDLVDELEQADEGLSKQVNDALRIAVEQRRRHRLLGELLDQLEAEHGPVPHELIEEFETLLR